jgi:hypothetical protein
MVVGDTDKLQVGVANFTVNEDAFTVATTC